MHTIYGFSEHCILSSGPPCSLPLFQRLWSKISPEGTTTSALRVESESWRELGIAWKGSAEMTRVGSEFLA